MRITSLQNKNIVRWAKLHQKKYRDAYRLFIIEEEHLIEEAKKANIVNTVIALEESGYDADIYVSEAVMMKLSQNRSLNNIIAICDFFDIQNDHDNKIIILDQVQDPGNAGTMIRTAYSFGYDKVILANYSVDKYNDKLISATQGALFHIDVEICDNLAEYLKELKANDYSILATALDHDAMRIENVVSVHKQAIIFGNEGSGISDASLKYADDKIYIEMAAFDSLNVAVASGIVMYYLR